MTDVQYRIAELLYRTGNIFLSLVRSLLYRSPPAAPASIAVLKTGHLGDTFCAIPAFRIIEERFPGSRIWLITSGKVDGLPHPTDVLNGIITFDGMVSFDPGRITSIRYLIGLLRKIRRERFDLLIYLGQYPAGIGRLLRDLVFYKLAGVRSVIGFRWVKHRVFRRAQREHGVFDDEVTRLVKLVSQPGAVRAEVRWAIPRVPVDCFHDLDSDAPLLAIHTDGKFPVNRWFPDRFRRLIDRLQESIQSAAIVIVGGRAEPTMSNLLHTGKGGTIIDLRGKTDYLELAEVLRRCDLLITTDSGPAHVAAAVGTPVVGIYSARDYPNCWHPHGDSNMVLRKEPDCQICMREVCDSMECISAITVEEVLSAVRTVLEDQHA